MHGLQVEEFRHVGVCEDMVTPLDSAKLKAKSPRKGAQIAEGHVRDRPTRNAPQKLSLVHPLSSNKEADVGRL